MIYMKIMSYKEILPIYGLIFDISFDGEHRLFKGLTRVFFFLKLKKKKKNLTFVISLTLLPSRSSVDSYFEVFIQQLRVTSNCYSPNSIYSLMIFLGDFYK